jgi:hypothetical protein
MNDIKRCIVSTFTVTAAMWRRAMDKSSNENGFTLVEVIIACAIGACFIIGLGLITALGIVAIHFLGKVW